MFQIVSIIIPFYCISNLQTTAYSNLIWTKRYWHRNISRHDAIHSLKCFYSLKQLCLPWLTDKYLHKSLWKKSFLITDETFKLHLKILWRYKKYLRFKYICVQKTPFYFKYKSLIKKILPDIHPKKTKYSTIIILYVIPHILVNS